MSALAGLLGLLAGAIYVYVGTRTVVAARRPDGLLLGLLLLGIGFACCLTGSTLLRMSLTSA